MKTISVSPEAYCYSVFASGLILLFTTIFMMIILLVGLEEHTLFDVLFIIIILFSSFIFTFIISWFVSSLIFAFSLLKFPFCDLENHFANDNCRALDMLFVFEKVFVFLFTIIKLDEKYLNTLLDIKQKYCSRSAENGSEVPRDWQQKK